MTSTNQFYLDPSQEYILKSLLKPDIGKDKNIPVVYDVVLLWCWKILFNCKLAL